MSKLCPPRAGRPSVTNKTNHIFAPTAGAFDLSQTLHADRERRDNSKSCQSFSIQRIIFHTGAKMLIFGRA